MAVDVAGADRIWFLDTLVTVQVGHEASADGISVLEHRGRQGDSPPLHVHHTEDEIFYILEGDFRFLLDGAEVRRGAGATVVAPRGVPHTYRVESAAGGRWLTLTAAGDFERFVRAFGRPAERAELPPPSGPPTREQVEALARECTKFGLELVGPPLHAADPVAGPA